MHADTLLQTLIKYGVDGEAMQERFMGDFALYESCFYSFLHDDTLALLGHAITIQDYKQALKEAHALKGKVENLGLTPYYITVATLVESLRAGDYNNVPQEYDDVKQADLQLRQVCAGFRKPLEGTSPKGTCPEKHRFTFNHFILLSIIAILSIFIIVFLGYSLLQSNYREKMGNESGQHLIETGTQIGIYIENRIANDWGILESTVQTIASSNNVENDSTILKVLQEQQKAWNIAGFMLYTANGSCVNTLGKAEQNGIASDTLAKTISNGSSFLIVDSNIVYTIPIKTEQTYLGSKIVALSLVRNMNTFLNEMEFTSFQNQAWIYLTDQSGVVISVFSGSNAPFTFNIKTIFDGKKVTQINANGIETDLFETEAATAYSLSDNPDDRYVISVPISIGNTEDKPLRLFYIVSKSVVNEALNNFSGQLTLFSLLTIGFMMGLAALLFYVIVRNRNQQFNVVLSKRDQMFDLLIQNTRIVFGLFNTRKREPDFISSNSDDVLGERYWTIEKSNSGYCLRTASGKETNMLQNTNARMSDWDGQSPFKSGYLCDNSTVPPSYFEMTLYPVGDVGEEYVGIIQDMTAAHDREEATKNAMEMAKRSDEAKTRFLANMSHDIRTPMNAIMNMSQFALGSTDEPERHEEYLKTIYDSSKHLLNLINDVLDMSRIESGQAILASEPFELMSELEQVTEGIKPLMLAKGQTLHVNFNGISTKAIRGDALKLSQIMTNLLSNAIKFTPQGGTVGFTVEEMTSLREDMINIRFTVSDTGIGIAEKNKASIFEPFSRVDDSAVQKIEGTGLGLSICKSFVDAMGGTIRCDSTVGVGSTFTVELFFHKSKVVAPPVEETSTPMRATFDGMRCLVVEDVLVNQAIAKKLLGSLGFTVEVANNGSEGVQKFLTSKPNDFDVIYMDIRMPVMDGYQATKEIRKSAHLQAKTIPILAMSANVFAEDIEKARVAGMNGYVGKPVTPKELSEQTARVLKKERGETE